MSTIIFLSVLEDLLDDVALRSSQRILNKLMLHGEPSVNGFCHCHLRVLIVQMMLFTGNAIKGITVETSLDRTGIN